MVEAISTAGFDILDDVVVVESGEVQMLKGKAPKYTALSNLT